jgi:MFS family permease
LTRPSTGREDAPETVPEKGSRRAVPVRDALRVLLTILRNRALVRVLFAFQEFSASEAAVWIAVSVFAYQRGGPTVTGLVLVAQLVPSAFVAPLGATFGDRMPRDRALSLGYAIQAATDLALALALWKAPATVAYVAAVVASCAITLTRPVHNAILPHLAETPEELTAANAASGSVEGVGVLVGPAFAAVGFAIAGPAFVVMVTAGFMATASLLTLRLPVHGGAGEPQPERSDAEGIVADAIAGARELRQEPGASMLLLLGGVQFVVVGLLDVFYALLAIDVLAVGESAAGILAAAMGVGGLFGAAASVTLVGRRHLTPAMQVGLAVCGGSLAAVGIVVAGMPGAVVFLVGCGAGRTFFDVAARTLLQRSVPDEMLARVFGVQEALVMLGLAFGSAAAPLLIAAFGNRGALVVAGVLLPTVGLLSWPRLRLVDERATKPGPEVEALRRLSLFAPLAQHVLERVARNLEQTTVAAGTVVIQQGDPGDMFYVVEHGRLSVEANGRAVAELRDGDQFGEIALLRDVPRTASVIAIEPSVLLVLGRSEFLEAVTGSRPSATRANEMIDRRLEELGRDE